MVNTRADRQIGISRDLETRGQKLFYEIRASDISTASEMRLKTPNQKEKGHFAVAFGIRPRGFEPLTFGSGVE